ncbi:MAG: putative ABC-type phosphonate transport system, periplasmic component PhnD [Herminiimonas sp.]|nr:putative ABC-type phosphonate transport system, periplasmic component PhnD [Herminiimonas sp.]
MPESPDKVRTAAVNMVFRYHRRLKFFAFEASQVRTCGKSFSNPTKRSIVIAFPASRTIKALMIIALAGSAMLSSGIGYAQQVLRVSAIPDEAPTELQRKFKPLGNYLEQKLGMKVEFTPVTDYAASVEGLINNKLDMVWFGGFTFVQAKVRSNGKVVPIVQREEDEKFKSVFITTDPSINKLQDLKGKTFAFGSESSTSGHLMPRSMLLAAKINPDTDMKRIAFSGAHDATVAAVAGGKVDAGALNISVWEKMLSEGKVDPKKVRVFYTTPGYYDYNWSVRSDMNPALRKKLTDAFLALDKNDPQGKAILELQRATRFIPTKAENYSQIEAAAQNAGLLTK